MLSDLWTIVWKEWREYLMQRGSVRGTIMSNLLMLAVFGVVLPLQSGPGWVQSAASMVAWAWVPLFLATGMVADSFAGERERHTLETLLASRISDRAILFGKISAAIAYSVIMIVVLLALGLVTTNLTNAGKGLLLYPLANVAAALAFGLLGSTLVAALGVLISLRAATVRQAAQTLSIGIVVVIWVPVLALSAMPPDLLQKAQSFAATLDVRTLGLLVVLALVTVDAFLLAIAMARFQRARLILD